jgi:hypothetical protein
MLSNSFVRRFTSCASLSSRWWAPQLPQELRDMKVHWFDLEDATTPRAVRPAR